MRRWLTYKVGVRLMQAGWVLIALSLILAGLARLTSEAIRLGGGCASKGVVWFPV